MYWVIVLQVSGEAVFAVDYAGYRMRLIATRLAKARLSEHWGVQGEKCSGCRRTKLINSRVSVGSRLALVSIVCYT